MCWHRQPVHPGQTTNSSLHQLFAFASCVKVYGYRNVVTNSARCVNCYSSIDLAARSFYVKQYTHSVIIRLGYPELQCSVCSQFLTISKPLRNCTVCITRITNYLENIDRELPLESPLTIHTFYEH